MHARPKSILHSIEIRQKSKTSLWEEKRVVIKCLLYVYICAMKGRDSLRLKEVMSTRSKEPDKPEPELEPKPEPELEQELDPEPDDVHLLPSCKPRLARKSAWVLNIRQFT